MYLLPDMQTPGFALKHTNPFELQNLKIRAAIKPHQPCSSGACGRMRPRLLGPLPLQIHELRDPASHLAFLRKKRAGDIMTCTDAIVPEFKCTALLHGWLPVLSHS